jgi:hypothetical protein
VQADLELLRKFGATQQTDIQHGIRPKVESLFRNVERERNVLAKYLPVLEVVARRYPPAWRHTVALYERSSTNEGISKAKRTVEQYLQLPAQQGDEREREAAWRKLAALRRETGDFVGEVNALIEMSRLPNCPIEDTTYTVRRFLNSLNKERDAWSQSEKLALIEELADRMESRHAELYPNDFGQLAWLYLNKGDTNKAERPTRATQRPKQREPSQPSGEEAEPLVAEIITSGLPDAYELPLTFIIGSWISGKTSSGPFDKWGYSGAMHLP